MAEGQLELLEPARGTLVQPKVRHKLLSWKERQFIRHYLECQNSRQAYMAVYPKASERTADVNASRLWRRIRQKLDDPEYIDLFDLGKEALYSHVGRILRAKKLTMRKVVVFRPGEEEPEVVEESVEVDDYTAQLGALRILAEIHGVGKTNVTVQNQVNLVQILQQAYERRMHGEVPGLGSSRESEQVPESDRHNEDRARGETG